jgi:hypothetical protein
MFLTQSLDSCQISCDDTLSKASEKGKCTLFKAVGLRKYDVHRRLHDEFDSLDLNSYLFYNFSVYKICIETIQMEQSLSGSLHK